MSSCRVGEHSRYELVLAVVRYILIDGHVLRNSGSRVEILKKDEFIFVHKMLSYKCHFLSSAKQLSRTIFLL